ncbi:MAG TPA: fimbrial assembly protein [Terracidiphilus sp.]|jgi:type IV pilus assembly protein PilN
MRITLNLATRPFSDLGPAIKRLRIGMGALALLSALLGLGLHAIHQKAEAARARDHSLDGQIARITQERQGYQDMMQRPDNAQLLKQAAMLNKLIDEKAFSWTLAMEDLETVLPGGVQVTQLEPVRAKDGHITLHLHVVGPRDRAVDLVRNLEHSKRFLLPRIVGENAQSTEGPGQHLEPVSASNRVDFDVLAEYSPAIAVERKTSHRLTLKSTDSTEPPARTQRSVRPLPLPGVRSAPAPGTVRAPYTRPAQLSNPPSGAPGAVNPNPQRSPNPAPGGPQ